MRHHLLDSGVGLGMRSVTKPHMGPRASAVFLPRCRNRTVSPRAYAEHLRAGRLRSSLKSGTTVSRALYDAGYGSPSRIYEGRSAGFGMTPATLARGGAGERINFAVADSALGKVLVAATPRGLCFVTLGDSDQDH